MKLIFITFILLVTLALLIHSRRHTLSLALRGGLMLCALSAMLIYSNFGNLHWYPKHHDRDFTQQTGTNSKHALLHWHEIYHYYLGAKYFKELSYYGLYETVYLADQEVRDSRLPVIKTLHIRDLSHPTHHITGDEALARARTHYRPNFTTARWQAFVSDWRTLKEIALQSWLDTAMFDAGFNPPPSWGVIGYPIANMIPISGNWLDWAIGWDMVEILPLFDVLLMLTASFFIIRSFGYAAFCGFMVIFGLNFLASGSWISGSFLRIQWFFGLIMGICMLKDKRWFSAGFWLGFSVLMRIFPLVFVAGAGMYLLTRLLQKRDTFQPLLRFIAGGVLISTILISTSLLIFGVEYWKLFFINILEHKNLFFVWHISYFKIAVFDQFVPNQNFWWADGLDRFRLWNDQLITNWQLQAPFQLPLTIALCCMSCLVATRLKAAECSLLVGITLLFLFSMPANYYYIFLALLPVIFMDAGARLRDTLLLTLTFGLTLAFQLIPSLGGGDDLTQNYRINITLFVFILLWILLRIEPLKRKAHSSLLPPAAKHLMEQR